MRFRWQKISVLAICAGNSNGSRAAIEQNDRVFKRMRQGRSVINPEAALLEELGRSDAWVALARVIDEGLGAHAFKMIVAVRDAPAGSSATQSSR